tara:strand:- start:2275 stop:2496 length:222 start_codon:yes stop_codon:yes gene_type:complete
MAERKEETQQKAEPRTYLITSEQLMNIMRYLMTRPYGEVVTLMNSLSQLPQLDSRVSAEFIKQPQGESHGRKK